MSLASTLRQQSKPQLPQCDRSALLTFGICPKGKRDRADVFLQQFGHAYERNIRSTQRVAQTNGVERGEMFDATSVVSANARFDLSGSPEPSMVLVLGRRQLAPRVQLFQPLSQVIPA